MDFYAILMTVLCFLSLVYIVFLFESLNKRKASDKQLRNLLKLRESALEINEILVNNSDTVVMYTAILDKALEIIEGANYGSILILKDDGFVYPAAYRGFEESSMLDFKLKLEDTFVYKTSNDGFKITTIINDLNSSNIINSAERERAAKNFRINSVITAPIYIGNKLHGLINVDSNQPEVFTDEDLHMMEYFRKQVEIALSKQLLYEDVLYLSRFDSLTGVYNRRYFDEIVNSYIKRSSRYGESFVLVVFDIDGLKFVNDNYGHIAGDVLIQTFASKLNANKRDSDLFARFGGDEFIAVYFNASVEQIENKLDLLREKLIKVPIRYNDFEFYCSFSFGCATFISDTFNFDELKVLADARMYEEKKIRKTCYNCNHAQS